MEYQMNKKNKVNGNSFSVFSIFSKGNKFCNFLFATVGDIALPKWGQLLKERICSFKSKFFPLRFGPGEKEGKK